MNGSFTTNNWGRHVVKTKVPTPGIVTHKWEWSHKSGASPPALRGSVPHPALQPLGPVQKRQVPQITGFLNQWRSHPRDSKGHEGQKYFSSRVWAQTHRFQESVQKEQCEKHLPYTVMCCLKEKWAFKQSCHYANIIVHLHQPVGNVTVHYNMN